MQCCVCKKFGETNNKVLLTEQTQNIYQSFGDFDLVQIDHKFGFYQSHIQIAHELSICSQTYHVKCLQDLIAVETFNNQHKAYSDQTHYVRCLNCDIAALKANVGYSSTPIPMYQIQQAYLNLGSSKI